MGDGSIAARVSPWYDGYMETIPFDLTPEQKGMLVALSHETGRPITALIAQALEELQEHAHLEREAGVANGHESESPAAVSQEVRTPIWEAFIEASLEIPDEELDLLPTDGATQHDHYIYGTPNRPV
jgi:hypothetical protein